MNISFYPPYLKKVLVVVWSVNSFIMFLNKVVFSHNQIGVQIIVSEYVCEFMISGKIGPIILADFITHLTFNLTSCINTLCIKV